MSEYNFPLSFYALCVVLVWLTARGILGVRSMFAYPTLAAMIGLSWVIPQGIELNSRPSNIYSNEAFWLYVTVCFICISIGFHAGYVARPKRGIATPSREALSFSNTRLLVAAAGLTALGQFAGFQMRGIDTSAMGGQWTGVITMWALLSKTSGFGLCLAALVFSRTRSLTALAVAAVAAVPLIEASLISVRREALFDLVILSAGSWYIATRRQPPRALVIVALFASTVILNTVGDIRGQVQSEAQSFAGIMSSAETYQEFDYFNLDQGEASEVGLAQYDFWYANKTWRWELGAGYWNSLVHQYVPAFLFGRDFKDSLKISTLSQRIDSGDEKGANSLGSTRTGFSDSYRAFGPLGVLAFYLISYFFGSLFYKSRGHAIDAHYLYLVLLAEGIKAITHSTSEFLATLPFTLLISWACFRFAKCDRNSPAHAGYTRENHSPGPTKENSALRRQA